MSAPCHSWEQASRFKRARQHAWEPASDDDDDDDDPSPEDVANDIAAEPDVDFDWGECSDSDVDEDVPATAEGMLIQFLLSLLFFRNLSAQQFCICMYWCYNAGLSGCKKYALHPNSQSGNYSRKIRIQLGHLPTKGELYEMDCPGHSKHDLSRTSHTVLCFPGHEQLADDMASDRRLRTQLREKVRQRPTPPAYHEHCVVKRWCNELVLPILVYLDGVPYSHTDSVLGVWFGNLVTGKRYLCAILRKRNICQCGCHGWCSFYPLFVYLLWSLRSLANKCWPDHRHDNSPWRPTDHVRAARAGEMILYPCACVYMKGDWMEYSHCVGFPTWQDNYRPCLKCNGVGENLYCTAGNTMESLRWRLSTNEDYNNACARCEFSLNISSVALRHRVSRLLKYNRRSDHGKGRTLTDDLVEYGLQKI